MAIGDFTTYSYTGAVQTITLSASKRYKIECWGAQGGDSEGRLGGYGGYAAGELYFGVDTEVKLYIGGKPTDKYGGWNGGGNGAATMGRGGGGAADIRIGGTALANRVLVAAGGGGGDGQSGNAGIGDGGGLVGFDGHNYGGTRNGLGATQSAGGAQGGALGQGGNSADTYANGGGGGGYYGGGGASGSYSGGGGGSSYVGGVEGGFTVRSRHSGHGEIKITEIATKASIQGPLTISYTGVPEIIRLSKGKYKLEAYGARGGTTTAFGNLRASGGYAAGEIELQDETFLFAFVGGEGYQTGSDGTGGWNGGAGTGVQGAGGGGASDLRMNGFELSSRILVGGGGGGSGAQRGAIGGGLVGGDVPDNEYVGGKGGTQLAGGTNSGSLGNGGAGASGSGGGGGGYYGGGGGGIQMGGGGGSSFYGTLDNPVTISGVNEGDGYIVITPITVPYNGFPQII